MIKQILCIFFISFLIGQEGRRGKYDNYAQGNDSSKKEKMEMMMVWRLTEALELNIEQAEKFFPRFREHRKGIEKIRLEIRDEQKEMREKVKKRENLTNNDVIKTMKKVKELRKKIADTEFEFLTELSDLLRPHQLASFGMFKQKMLNDIKGEFKENNRMDRKRGKKGKWDRKRNRRF